MKEEQFPQRKLVPDSLEEWLSEWVYELKSYEDKPVIIKVDYTPLLEGVYRN